MSNSLKSVTHGAYVPPSLHPVYMGATPPTKSGVGSTYQNYHVSYFQNYRNEVLSRFTMPEGQWGLMSSAYTPKPDLVAANRMADWRSLDSPMQNMTQVMGQMS